MTRDEGTEAASGGRSRWLFVTGNIVTATGAAIAFLPAAPLDATPVLHLLAGGLLLALGFFVMVASASSRNRYFLGSALLAVLLLVTLMRGAGEAVRSLGAVSGEHPHIRATFHTGPENIYANHPADEAPRDATSPKDPVISSMIDDNRRNGQRLVVAERARIDSVIYDPRPVGSALAVARDVLPHLLAVVTVALTWLLLRRVRAGDPFGRSTSRLMIVLGIVLLVGLPLIQLLEWAAVEAALGGNRGYFGLAGDVPSPLPDPASLLPGLLVLVVASAWRTGAELRDLEARTI